MLSSNQMLSTRRPWKLLAFAGFGLCARRPCPPSTNTSSSPSSASREFLPWKTTCWARSTYPNAFVHKTLLFLLLLTNFRFEKRYDYYFLFFNSFYERFLLLKVIVCVIRLKWRDSRAFCPHFIVATWATTHSCRWPSRACDWSILWATPCSSSITRPALSLWPLGTGGRFCWLVRAAKLWPCILSPLPLGQAAGVSCGRGPWTVWTRMWLAYNWAN